MHRRTLIKAATAAVASAGAPAVWASTDEAPLRILIPYAAGGLTDLLARLITDSMGATLKRTVLCENKPGAAGLIATSSLLSQGADGSQVMLVNSGFTSLPQLSLNAKYDPLKDFKPVSQVCTGASMLMVHHEVPAKTLQEFVAWAKSRPEGITAANAGAGSSGHISTMLLAKRAGLNITHVPYKGSAETANALISGQVQMQLTVTTSALNDQVKAGKVRLLGVTSATPSRLTPELPPIATVAPGFRALGWYGLVAHGGVPDAKIQRYSDAIEKALKEPGVEEKYASIFMEMEHKPAPVFRAEMERSVAYWKQVTTELNLKRV